MPIEFRTSLYGRIGHLAMAVLPLALATFLGAALIDIPFTHVSSWGGILLIFLVCTWVSIYCICFAFEWRDRIICTREQMVYRGPFGTTTLRWSDVSELWIDFGGRTPFVFLLVRAKRKWPYRINMSGLQPTYVAVFALARKMAPAAKVWTPKGYQLLEEANGKWLQPFAEDSMDDPLTLVRTDAPDDARRTTKR